MSDRRNLLDDRVIEYDGLALAVMAGAFSLVAALTGWVVASSAQRFDATVIAAAIATGVAVVGAWIFGYPRRAAIPAMALVILCAMIALPMIFTMDGALMREAANAPRSRVYVVMGLYVGGLGVAFLAFFVFGFLGPLAGAILAARRGDPHARRTLALHGALTAAAFALTFLPRVWL